MTERDDPDVYGFGAYARLGKERPELKSGNRQWLASLAEQGFVYTHDGHDAWLTRWLEPTELVVHKTLDAQAEFLATWIVKAFEDLGQAPT